VGIITILASTILIQIYRKESIDFKACAQLASIIEHSSDAIIGNTLDGIIVSWNTGATKIFGYTEEEAKGKSESILLPHGQSDEIPEFFGIVKSGKAIVDFETIRMRKDGTLIPVSLTLSPVVNSSGVITGVSTIGHDITDRKRLEKQLDDERTFINAVLQTSGGLLTVIDKNGKIERFNKTCEELTGYTADEVKGRSVIDLFILPEERDEVTKVAGRLFAGEKRVSWENYWITKSGGKLFIRWQNSILLDNNGAPAYAIATGIDITDRKITEERLRESENRIRRQNEMLQFAPVLARTLADEIILWNRGAQNLYGFTEDEAVHKVSHVLLNTQFPQPLDEIRRSLFDNNQWNGELLHKRKDGSLVVIHSLWVLQKDQNGNPESIIEINADITERKKLEAALEDRAHELEITNKELESFSYSVAHDLRNPLRAMTGFAGFLKEDCSNRLDNECKDYIQRINDSADRMNSIIDDMLALSKISRQEMQLVDVDLSEMARLTFTELKKNQPNHAFIMSIQDNIRVRADARLMSVAIGNLIGNAWKYSSKSEHPRIEFGYFKKDGERVYYVKDNGAGFDMSKANDLFVPFKRLHSEKEFKGTGVGLAIVERAIVRHGGKIWAESEVGKGATFYFTLEEIN
jgi:PAS domain S-box-containing protein